MVEDLLLDSKIVFVDEKAKRIENIGENWVLCVSLLCIFFFYCNAAEVSSVFVSSSVSQGFCFHLTQFLVLYVFLFIIKFIVIEYFMVK